jgi:hypothetical protein
MISARRSLRVLSCAGLVAWGIAHQTSSWVAAQSAPQQESTPALATDAEREAFLSKARVVRTRPAAKGVTNTLRATLSDGVVTHDASIQTIDQSQAVFQGNRGTELNFTDRWQFNVAAYKIDRLLGIYMIPTTVERRHGSSGGSFTWWVDDVLMDEQERYRQKHSAPDTEDWNQQMSIVRLFDQLIANVDRNLGNLLIDKQWAIWMIDHSRAFRINKDLRSPENVTRAERQLLERLRNMDRDALRQELKNYLNPTEIDALVARRDVIVERIEKAGPRAIFERPSRCC